MINFPIVDTHVHLWDLSKISYPWLSGIPFLNRTFLLEDYNQACGPVTVEKILFMQCECDPAQYKDEVAWVTGLAREKDPRIKGIVSWAPLEKGEAARDEVEALARNKLVKGIRRIIQFEEDLEFCLQPDFIKGVRMLPAYGLVFDICIAHYHLKNTIKFVVQCPDVRFILDHIGKPDIRRGLREPWFEDIRELARFDNVSCKMSSLATEADHQHWTIDDVRPYVEHIIECFGFGRTIFGGDWPVSSQAAAYPRCVETIERILSGSSESDMKRLFHDNAEGFYGI